MRTNNGNKGPTPKIYEGTDTAIKNRIKKKQLHDEAIQLLKKCKESDKDKKEYPVPGSPVKTWFISSSKIKAEKSILKFKQSLIINKNH